MQFLNTSLFFFGLEYSLFGFLCKCPCKSAVSASFWPLRGHHQRTSFCETEELISVFLVVSTPKATANSSSCCCCCCCCSFVCNFATNSTGDPGFRADQQVAGVDRHGQLRAMSGGAASAASGASVGVDEQRWQQKQQTLVHLLTPSVLLLWAEQLAIAFPAV